MNPNAPLTHPPTAPASWQIDRDGYLDIEQDEAGVVLVISLVPSEVRLLYAYLASRLGPLDL